MIWLFVLFMGCYLWLMALLDIFNDRNIPAAMVWIFWLLSLLIFGLTNLYSGEPNIFVFGSALIVSLIISVSLLQLRWIGMADVFVMLCLPLLLPETAGIALFSAFLLWGVSLLVLHGKRLLTRSKRVNGGYSLSEENKRRYRAFLPYLFIGYLIALGVSRLIFGL